MNAETFGILYNNKLRRDLFLRLAKQWRLESGGKAARRATPRIFRRGAAVLTAAILSMAVAPCALPNTIEVGRSSSNCGLSDAIMNHNAAGTIFDVCGAGSGNDVILIPDNYTEPAYTPFAHLEEPLLPAIERTLTIQPYPDSGGCAVISGAAYLTVSPRANLTLNGVGMSADGSHNRSMIDNQGGTLTIKPLKTPCLFSNNRTANLPETGGILFNFDNGQSTIDGALFDFSHARAEGGAIYLQTGKLNITSNTGFTTTISSTSSDRGGAIWVSSGATLNIASSNFKIINNEAGSAGGAIYNDRGTVTIARGNGSVLNISLAGNKSRSGGAIFSSDGSLSVIGAVFSNNSATENGGGIFADSVSPFSISQTYFNNNSARDGGAIYNQDLLLSVAASTFVNNTSTR
jgi:predicted outer membrane repeat protein